VGEDEAREALLPPTDLPAGSRVGGAGDGESGQPDSPPPGADCPACGREWGSGGDPSACDWGQGCHALAPSNCDCDHCLYLRADSPPPGAVSKGHYGTNPAAGHITTKRTDPDSPPPGARGPWWRLGWEHKDGRVEHGDWTTDRDHVRCECAKAIAADPDLMTWVERADTGRGPWAQEWRWRDAQSTRWSPWYLHSVAHHGGIKVESRWISAPVPVDGEG